MATLLFYGNPLQHQAHKRHSEPLNQDTYYIDTHKYVHRYHAYDATIDKIEQFVKREKQRKKENENKYWTVEWQLRERNREQKTIEKEYTHTRIL